MRPKRKLEVSRKMNIGTELEAAWLQRRGAEHSYTMMALLERVRNQRFNDDCPELAFRATIYSQAMAAYFYEKARKEMGLHHEEDLAQLPKQNVIRRKLDI